MGDYKGATKCDKISQTVIEALVARECKFHIFDTIDSTNNYAKTLEDMSLPHLIVADHQTNGRGRLGRSFYSPSKKGIYMTICFEPNFDLQKILLITPIAALAVCQAFEEVAGVSPSIKWVNDVYIEEKKACGILTEAESNPDAGAIGKIIVGIGINCFEQEFPEDIKEKAIYIASSSKDFTRNQMIASVYNKFFELLVINDTDALIGEYRSRSMLLGKEVLVYGTNQSALPENGGQGIRAMAIDIDRNAGLVVEYQEGPFSGQRETLTSGEVTIKKI